jgi:hypothetical protein
LTRDFEIDWDRSKIHHPVPNQDSENGLFTSDNYVARLRDDRVSLPEYAALRGLWCEVQVQTTLNHAWAEMAHDTIYKRPDTSGFGNRSLTAIETRMNNIMRNYLIPAGYEFQKVVYDARRLSDGLELFDRGVFEELKSSPDNNHRFDILQRFVDFVIPNYDDPAGIYPEIRIALVAAVKAARVTQQLPIRTPFGEMRGHTSDQIERLAADVFERLRYLNIKQTFDVACELYLEAGDAESRKVWEGLAVKLAKNELETWRQVGPAVQWDIVLRIESFSAEERLALKDLLLSVLIEVLSPEVTGTSSTWNTVTFHQGPIPASDLLKQMRIKALEHLRSLFDSTSDAAFRDGVIGAFIQSTRTPSSAESSGDLLKIILHNSLWVVDYFNEAVDNLPFELRQRLEHDLYFIYVHRQRMPEDLAKAVGAETALLVSAILRFRDKVNADPDFAIYKTLVGYQSIFPDAWLRKDFDFEADEDYRNKRIDELVDSVGPENASKWLGTLQRCAQTESNDLATFPSLSKFLRTLAARNPTIVLDYIADLDGRLSSFLPAMLAGLSEGKAADEVFELVRIWLEKRQYVAQIMRYLRFSKSVNPELLQVAIKVAIEIENDAALLDAIHVAAEHHSSVEGGLIESIIMPSIEILNSKGNYYWIDEISYLTRRTSILSEITIDQANRILAALVQHTRIDSRAKAILTMIGSRWPERIIDLFERRLEHANMDTSGYEAIPFRINGAIPLTAQSAAMLVNRTYDWYQAKSDLFSYRGGRLVAALYPTFPDILAAAIIDLIRGSLPSKIEYVICILRAYDGQSALRPICRELVMQLPHDDPLLVEVEVVLDATGMVSGEFGFVQAYQTKKREIEPWLEDPDPAVQAFARRYRRGLDRRIAAEQRRSEEAMELRKRSSGEINDNPELA